MADPAGRETEDRFLSASATATLAELAARLQAIAISQSVTVGTAESCTGGLVGHSITSIPGSSAYYIGGVVSYSDALKERLLGVPQGAIERHGAVSAQVAMAMAHGVRDRTGCDYGVAVTGVAGPDGGSEAKPVGLTYVATAGPGGDEVQRRVWTGGRDANKEDSAAMALEMLRRVIEAAEASA